MYPSGNDNIWGQLNKTTTTKLDWVLDDWVNLNLKRQLSKLATAGGFLLVQGVTFGVGHCFLPRPVVNKAKVKPCPPRKAFTAICFWFFFQCESDIRL